MQQHASLCFFPEVLSSLGRLSLPHSAFLVLVTDKYMCTQMTERYQGQVSLDDQVVQCTMAQITEELFGQVMKATQLANVKPNSGFLSLLLYGITSWGITPGSVICTSCISLSGVASCIDAPCTLLHIGAESWAVRAQLQSFSGTIL